jgi:hypothetical protein
MTAFPAEIEHTSAFEDVESGGVLTRHMLDETKSTFYDLNVVSGIGLVWISTCPLFTRTA